MCPGAVFSEKIVVKKISPFNSPFLRGMRSKRSDNNKNSSPLPECGEKGAEPQSDVEDALGF